MENLTLARFIHVIAVVLWIGGVAMVTTVIIPAIKEMKSAEDRIHFLKKLKTDFLYKPRSQHSSLE